MDFLLKGRASWPVQIVIWALSFYLAWYIVPKGYDKLADIPGTIAFFGGLGIAPVFAYIVGALEIIAPLMMFVPRLSFYGAVPTAVIMFYASYSMNWNTWPLTLGVLAVVVAALTWPAFLKKKKPITKISI